PAGLLLLDQLGTLVRGSGRLARFPFCEKRQHGAAPFEAPIGTPTVSPQNAPLAARVSRTFPERPNQLAEKTTDPRANLGQIRLCAHGRCRARTCDLLL